MKLAATVVLAAALGAVLLVSLGAPAAAVATQPAASRAKGGVAPTSAQSGAPAHGLSAKQLELVWNVGPNGQITQRSITFATVMNNAIEVAVSQIGHLSFDKLLKYIADERREAEEMNSGANAAEFGKPRKFNPVTPHETPLCASPYNAYHQRLVDKCEHSPLKTCPVWRETDAHTSTTTDYKRQTDLKPSKYRYEPVADLGKGHGVVSLTKFNFTKPCNMATEVDNRIIHVGESDHLKLKEAAKREYLAALEPQKDELDVKDHAALMHYYLAQAMPYERGSAAIADAMTRALLRKHGIAIGRPKPGVLVDLEAMLKSPTDFVRRYYKDLYELV